MFINIWLYKLNLDRQILFRTQWNNNNLLEYVQRKKQKQKYCNFSFLKYIYQNLLYVIEFKSMNRIKKIKKKIHAFITWRSLFYIWIGICDKIHQNILRTIFRTEHACSTHMSSRNWRKDVKKELQTYTRQTIYKVQII